MFNLSEYRNKPQNLADFLPWAALVEEGIVLNKDGSFQRTAHFRGPDLESATPAELVGVTARLNNALRRLGSGWAIFVEASRFPARGYPASTFPDPVSTLVDAERAAQFEEEGAHFESAYYLTFVFLPPPEEAARAEAFLYEGRVDERGIDPHQILRGFIDRTDRVLQLIEGFVPEAAWLSNCEARTRGADVSRCRPDRRAAGRRAGAAGRQGPSAHADRDGFPPGHLSGRAKSNRR
jgi:type IV secretion system protein VirB4